MSASRVHCCLVVFTLKTLSIAPSLRALRACLILYQLTNFPLFFMVLLKFYVEFDSFSLPLWYFEFDLAHAIIKLTLV